MTPKFPSVDSWDWIGILRRVRCTTAEYAVALTLATYGDPDGTRVRPGLALLSYTAKCNYKTAQAAVAKWVKVGMLELVHKGSGRPGERGYSADEYQLILHPDLFDLLAAAGVEYHDPDQQKAAVDKIRESRRGVYTPRPKTLHPIGRGAEEAPEPLLRPNERAAGAPAPVDNVLTTCGDPVENPVLHPIPRGAEPAPDNRSAPHWATAETGSAPQSNAFCAPPTGAPPTTYLPPKRPTTSVITVVDQPHGVARARSEPNEDPDLSSMVVDASNEPTAKILIFPTRQEAS